MNKRTLMTTSEAVVDNCAVYWLGRGLSRTVVTDMCAELRDHLHAALRDGKSISDVTGDDLHAFAASWGQTYIRPAPLHRRMIDWSSTIVWLVAAMSMSKHVYAQSPLLEVYWSDVALVLVVAAFVPLARHLVFGWITPVSTKWWQRAESIAALVGLVVVVLLGLLVWLVQRLAPQPLFEWPWWLSAALAVLAAGLTALALRTDPTRPVMPATERNWYGWRWVWVVVLALVIGALLRLLIATHTIWYVAAATLILLGGLCLWLWLLYVLTQRRDRL
jgi:hypothetical protein